MHEDLIRQLCDRFKIILVDIRDHEELIANSTGRREDWIDNCYIIGSDEIDMGYYDDDNKRLASIFHEIGHILIHKTAWPPSMSSLYWEILCWNIGLEFAFKEYGVVFDEEVINWAYREKALTYYHYK